MSGIERFDVSEEWAHSGIIKAGDFYFLSYCVGNIGGTIEEQINGAFDQMEERLALFGLTLECRWIAYSVTFGTFRLWRRLLKSVLTASIL